MASSIAASLPQPRHNETLPKPHISAPIHIQSFKAHPQREHPPLSLLSQPHY